MIYKEVNYILNKPLNFASVYPKTLRLLVYWSTPKKKVMEGAPLQSMRGDAEMLFAHCSPLGWSSHRHESQDDTWFVVWAH